MRFRLSERPGLAAALALAVALFVIANRGAYQGWFSDDDLDNLGWTTIVGQDVFVQGWLTPFFSPDNFRPTGHVAYRLMHAWFGLEFRPWIVVLQFVHLVNTLLVYFVCRRWGAGAQGALGGAALFVFHPAVLAAFWKPMYVFDLLCCTWLLVAFLFYGGGWRLVASVACFWMAYKAKEVAIFFPLVLAMFEWVGERRWWRLTPFFAVSASFGLQALWMTRGRESDYALRFTAKAFSTCAGFYFWEALYLPVVLAAFARDRRVWWGLAAFAVLVGPLWFLPGRLFAVYLYVPMIGLAVATAFVLDRVRVPVMAVVLVAWFAGCFLMMREFRKKELTVAMADRAFFDETCRAVKGLTPPKVVFFEGQPPFFAAHGVAGAIRQCFGKMTLDVEAFEPGVSRGELLVSWDGKRSRVWKAGEGPWLLGEGWSRLMGPFRWTKTRASLRVEGTGSALVVRGTSRVPGQELVVSVGGRRLGAAVLAKPGPFEAEFAGAGPGVVELVVAPGFHISGFGDAGLAVEEVALR